VAAVLVVILDVRVGQPDEMWLAEDYDAIEHLAA
jgi:hypothetical protein